MPDRITPEINRTVETGPGNWIGATGWEPGPYYDHLGMLAIDLPNVGDEVEVTLAYPYLDLPADTNQWFYWSYISNPLQTGWLQYWMQLYDASGILDAYAGTELPGTPWLNLRSSFLTPPSWQKTTAGIIYTVRRIGGAPGLVYIDSFSMPYTEPTPTRSDHLPLVGLH